ncbi:hypothetical protein [Streptacidiphilus sp. MAP5-3]|uniref:hypothetical protein n=1 Tax=unclassified Streptacidiphilus TaxID=2643834 RepID=UPI00351636E9
MPADLDALLEEYLREPRAIRRAVSRDLARANPVPPKPPQYGAVGRRIRGHLARRRSPRACSEWEMYRDRARRSAERQK